MQTLDRLSQIVSIVDAHGFLSVKEISELCQVSEMTIRRDLQRLAEDGLLQRTYGGAVSMRGQVKGEIQSNDANTHAPLEGLLVDRVDVLVATSINQRSDKMLLEQVNKKGIPIITESIAMAEEETLVAVDDYLGGLELGRWSGDYANRYMNGQARALDLTFSLQNTTARSRGFAQGLLESCPNAEIVLSLNGQSLFDTAYQLTRDALTVHPSINIIFSINDIMAWGAIQACKDLNILPGRMLVLTFGLEGDTLKDALMEGEYCKVGLAHFPEIVGPTCVEAAIAAFNHEPLPTRLVTPFSLLTAETLPDVYTRTPQGWRINWNVARKRYNLPLALDDVHSSPHRHLPRRIGFIVPFHEHEWYRSLIEIMRERTLAYGIDFEVVDAEKNARQEADLRRRAIARAAATLVSEGDVVLVDGGLLAGPVAEALRGLQNITVITNSLVVFEVLDANPNVTLILTGGAYRRSSQMLVGPTAENALRELRADKLFLMVSGISQNFGLSHTNISEVTIKQAMIRSAREVILLADHSFFGIESVAQVAPLKIVHKLVTDDGLPASVRLDLSKLGIQILLAHL